MSRKKQVATLVSIAGISFLIGTTFNVMTMATDGGNPFEKIWGIINNLESRVGIVEDELNQTRTMRFFDPLEYSCQFLDGWQQASNFTWIPNNKTNNAILSIVVYAGFRINETFHPDVWIESRVQIYDSEGIPYGPWKSHEKHVSHLTTNYTVYSWEFVSWRLPSPNLEMYEITVQFKTSDHGQTAYIRNINLILTVLDGMPTYNP